MTNKEIAKHVFARNPKLTELFITSDKKAFYEEHNADAYAQRLKDRKVIKMERDKDEEIDVTPKQGADTISNTAAAVGGAPKDTKNEGDAKDETGDQGEGGDQDKKLEDMSFKELKEVASKEEVDTDAIEGQLSSAKLIEAINKKRAESQELDFSKMTSQELVAYGKETFDLELKADAPAEELISTLNDHINALEADDDK